MRVKREKYITEHKTFIDENFSQKFFCHNYKFFCIYVIKKIKKLNCHEKLSINLLFSKYSIYMLTYKRSMQ